MTTTGEGWGGEVHRGEQLWVKVGERWGGEVSDGGKAGEEEDHLTPDN